MIDYYYPVMCDNFGVYLNIRRALESRDGVLASAPLTEKTFKTTFVTTGYVAVRGRRADHAFRPNSNILFLYFDPESENIQKNVKFERVLNIEAPETGDVDNIIIVTHNQISHHIRNVINGIRTKRPNLHIEVCMHYKFLTNFTESSVYCKHEIADPAEIKKLCDQQRFDPNFKHIRADDTGAVWVGARAGDIVKITMPSHNAGYSIDYRCVV